MEQLFHSGVRLLASAFPERADVYICDSCGRDITKLHPGEAHIEQPIGPVRYVCLCGRKWLSGAAEWDHLGDWERRRRVQGRSGLSILFGFFSSVIGALLYFVMYRIGVGKRSVIVALVIAILPAILIIVPFSMKVLASLWRTRFRNPSHRG